MCGEKPAPSSQNWPAMTRARRQVAVRLSQGDGLGGVVEVALLIVDHAAEMLELHVRGEKVVLTPAEAQSIGADLAALAQGLAGRK